MNIPINQYKLSKVFSFNFHIWYPYSLVTPNKPGLGPKKPTAYEDGKKEDQRPCSIYFSLKDKLKTPSKLSLQVKRSLELSSKKKLDTENKENLHKCEKATEQNPKWGHSQDTKQSDNLSEKLNVMQINSSSVNISKQSPLEKLPHEMTNTSKNNNILSTNSYSNAAPFIHKPTFLMNSSLSSHSSNLSKSRATPLSSLTNTTLNQSSPTSCLNLAKSSPNLIKSSSSLTNSTLSLNNNTTSSFKISTSSVTSLTSGASKSAAFSFSTTSSVHRSITSSTSGLVWSSQRAVCTPTNSVTFSTSATSQRPHLNLIPEHPSSLINRHLLKESPVNKSTPENSPFLTAANTPQRLNFDSSVKVPLTQVLTRAPSISSITGMVTPSPGPRRLLKKTPTQMSAERRPIETPNSARAPQRVARNFASPMLSSCLKKQQVMFFNENLSFVKAFDTSIHWQIC